MTEVELGHGALVMSMSLPLQDFAVRIFPLAPASEGNRSCKANGIPKLGRAKVKDHHLLLVTLLLFNTVANEAPTPPPQSEHIGYQKLWNPMRTCWPNVAALLPRRHCQSSWTGLLAGLSLSTY